MTISLWIFRLGNVSDKSCRDNQNTFHFQQLFSENCAVYGITWKNVVKPDRTQTTKYGVCTLHAGYGYTGAHTRQRTHPHTHKYALLVFRRQQWFRERTWLLRYTYTASLVTQCHGRKLSTRDSYSECREIHSWSKDHLLWFKPVVFLYFRWSNLQQTLKLDHGCFLSHSFKLTAHYHRLIQHYTIEVADWTSIKG
jgi:hypothetical protein